MVGDAGAVRRAGAPERCGVSASNAGALGVPSETTLPSLWQLTLSDHGCRRACCVSGAEAWREQFRGELLHACTPCASAHRYSTLSAALCRLSRAASKAPARVSACTSWRERKRVCVCVQVMAGLLGIPPSNCVIPQAPMHTKSLITLKQMLVERNEKRKSRLDLSALDAKTKSQLNLTALDGAPVAEARQEGGATDRGPVAEAAGAAGSPLSSSSGRSSVDVLAKYGIEKARSSLVLPVLDLQVMT